MIVRVSVVLSTRPQKLTIVMVDGYLLPYQSLSVHPPKKSGGGRGKKIWGRRLSASRLFSHTTHTHTQTYTHTYKQIHKQAISSHKNHSRKKLPVAAV